MLREFLRMCHQFKFKWLILSVLGFLILMGYSGQDTSAQDASVNDLFLPLISNQPAAPQSDLHGDDHDHDGIGHIPEHGRFTTNDGGEQSWPPQVKYMDEVLWDGSINTAMLDSERSVNVASSVANQDSSVRELLGERYTFISAHPIREKGVEAALGEKVTYFSYSNNSTVEVTIGDGRVTALDSIAASDWQPPLRQNEVDAAIEIARQYWRSQGNSRVDELQGFTIQTFQTEGAGGYYDTRMTYVSFHVDEVSVPELLTWVDLTTESIFRAAVDNGIENGGVQHVQ